MGDDGCRAILDALKAHSTLERLNISANASGTGTSASIVALLRLNPVVTQLDVSVNPFGEAGVRDIRKALEQNTMMQV